MSTKIIQSKNQARKSLHTGIKKLADAVITTMGPAGRLVLIERPGFQPHLTKDGVTVAKNVVLEDPIENLGATMIRQAADTVVSQAGDGTTSVTRLSAHLVDVGMEAVELGMNPVGLKKGMLKAATDAVNRIPDLSLQIEGTDQLKSIATISANGDEEIGKTIAEAMNEVGADGVVVIEESRNSTTSYELIEGMEFARGYMTPYFSNNEAKQIAQFTKPKILLVNNQLGEVSEKFLGILNTIAQSSTPLVIIAESFSEHVISTLVLNKSRGTLKVCAVKAPDYGDRRTHVMNDIALLTGATLLDTTRNHTFKNFEMDWLGTAEKITVTKDTTVIVGGGGSQETIEGRIIDLKTQIEHTQSQYDKEFLQERLSKLLGGVAVINVGGLNETDMLERKDRFEDALNATKSALHEGVVPGGGIAYLKLAESIEAPKKLTTSELYGYNMVKNGMSIFFKSILSNAGYAEEDIYKVLMQVSDRGFSNWRGVDIETKGIIDYKSKGIIDPAKVIRSVISEAVGVAANILLVEAVIAEQPKQGEETLN